MKLKLSILLFLSACFGLVRAQEQPQARIAGLERNAEYMSLLRDDARLQYKVDSLSALVGDMREKFVGDGAERKKYSADILRVEGEIFALRGEKGRLAKRINAIEQSWILANMASPSSEQSRVKSNATDAAAATGSDTRRYADLTRNSYFSESLSPEDYAALRKAQRDERVAADLLGAYSAAYDAMAALKGEYAAADNEAAADSLMALFLARRTECAALSDSLSSLWGHVFDNKTYLYDLLFDKEGRTDMLSKAEANVFRMRQNIARMRGVYASDAAVDYFFQKQCIVDYEMDVADAVGLRKAADSLAAVRKSLDGLRYRFEEVNLKRRYFLDYEPLRFSTKYVYNSKNPVPECTVYEHGEMFRIKLGEFTARQPVTKFKGIDPVAYLRTAGGGWRYYGGGYPSVEAAEKDLQTVKRLGFRSADIAAWIDGNYADSRAEIEEMNSRHFHIEISGTDNLSADVRRIITQNAADCELSRVGNDVFVVNNFRSREAAEVVARSIISLDGTLTVKVEASER